MENLRHSPSLKIMSVTFCNNRDAAYHNQSSLSTSIVPLQILSTVLAVSNSCTLEWMYSSGKSPILFAQSILSTFRSSQHSISSVTVYTRLCIMMRISKCTSSIAYLVQVCKYVCVWWHVSTRSIERISTSFLCSYSIWDDEWWWVSRRVLMMRSRLDLWDSVSISTSFCCHILD